MEMRASRIHSKSPKFEYKHFAAELPLGRRDSGRFGPEKPTQTRPRRMPGGSLASRGNLNKSKAAAVFLAVSRAAKSAERSALAGRNAIH